MKLKSTGMIPPGGWYFVQDGIRLSDADFKSTVALIAKHRKSNNLPPGNPEDELHAFTCKRWKKGCLGYNLPQQILNYVRMGKKFFKIIQMQKKEGLPLESKEEADRRAAICAGCELNMDAIDVRPGCKPCREGASKLIQGVRQRLLKGAATSSDEKLKVCGACGCDNKLQVWFPLHLFNLTPEERKEFPAPCWKA